MALISGRGAARILADLGLSLSASQHLLATGIAGRPERTSGMDLYDESAVRRLAALQLRYARTGCGGVGDCRSRCSSPASWWPAPR